MLNKVTIMGRLVREPELRRTDSGKAVCSFTIACERDFAGKGGERECDLPDCVAWASTGEFVCRNFRKGDMIALSGRLQTMNWTDKNGGKRKSLEINVENVSFCGGRKDR